MGGVVLLLMMMMLMLPNKQPSAAVTASSAAPTGDGERCALLHFDLHHHFPARKRYGARRSRLNLGSAIPIPRHSPPHSARR
jgi:hypothetical protein